MSAGNLVPPASRVNSFVVTPLSMSSSGAEGSRRRAPRITRACSSARVLPVAAWWRRARSGRPSPAGGRGSSRCPAADPRRRRGCWATTRARRPLRGCPGRRRFCHEREDAEFERVHEGSPRSAGSPGGAVVDVVMSPPSGISARAATPRWRRGPAKPAPQSIPFAVRALPRRVGRSVGSTPRFGRDCWPEGQLHSTRYSENVCKTTRRKIKTPAGLLARPPHSNRGQLRWCALRAIERRRAARTAENPPKNVGRIPSVSGSMRHGPRPRDVQVVVQQHGSFTPRAQTRARGPVRSLYCDRYMPRKAVEEPK